MSKSVKKGCCPICGKKVRLIINPCNLGGTNSPRVTVYAHNKVVFAGAARQKWEDWEGCAIVTTVKGTYP